MATGGYHYLVQCFKRSRHKEDESKDQSRCSYRPRPCMLHHAVLSGFLICLGLAGIRQGFPAHSVAADVLSSSDPHDDGGQVDNLHGVGFIHIEPAMSSPASVNAAKCTVESQLPAGLALDKSACVIQGVPLRRQNGSSAERFVVAAGSSTTAILVQVELTKSHTTGMMSFYEHGLRHLSNHQSMYVHQGKLYIGQGCSLAEVDLHSGDVQLLLGNHDAQGGNCGCKSWHIASPCGAIGGPLSGVQYADIRDIRGLVVYREELYFSNFDDDMVSKVGLPGSAAPGRVSRVAGTGRRGEFDDDASLSLQAPCGLAILSGKLLIAEWRSSRIRAVDLDGKEKGIITTVAGTGGRGGFAGDGGPARLAKLKHPTDLLVVAQMLYFIDSGNHRIRSIDFQQSPPKIATLAGGGEKNSYGAPAAEWQLSNPTSLTLGPDGKMYFIACSRALLAIDLQQPHHPISLGSFYADSYGNGGLVAAAAGPGTVYLASSSDEFVAVNILKDGPPTSLATEGVDTVPYLGTWSSLKADGTLASTFTLPASRQVEPVRGLVEEPEGFVEEPEGGSKLKFRELVTDDFRFSLRIDGLKFSSPCLGVASMAAIRKLAANLQSYGSPTASSSLLDTCALLPVEGYRDAFAKAQRSDAIIVTGTVQRVEAHHLGGSKYRITDVMCNGMGGFYPPIPLVNASGEVSMHIFMAAWGSPSQLAVVVATLPLPLSARS